MPKKALIGILVVMAVSAGICVYYEYERLHPSTDDAYVGARLVRIVPKVRGYIKHVHVTQNEYVQKGAPLVTLRGADYRRAVENAERNLVISRQEVLIAKEQVAAAAANLESIASQLAYTESMARRHEGLFERNAGSQQDAQLYRNEFVRAKATQKSAKPGVAEASVRLEMAKNRVGIAEIRLQDALANLGATELEAPANGYVSNLNSYAGQLAEPGGSLLGFVDSNEWWVDANFKETELARIRPGQETSVVLDLYDHTYKGRVTSISYVSGSTFSLLPSQNATGNWVKVTQRFAVRIHVSNSKHFPLRVGASASVTVDTTGED